MKNITKIKEEQIITLFDEDVKLEKQEIKIKVRRKEIVANLGKISEWMFEDSDDFLQKKITLSDRSATPFRKVPSANNKYIKEFADLCKKIDKPVAKWVLKDSEMIKEPSIKEILQYGINQ